MRVLGLGGTHLDSSSRHLSDKDGFDGFKAVGSVAEGRLPACPGPLRGQISVNEIETDI